MAGVSTTPEPSALASEIAPARVASTRPVTPSAESARSSSGSPKASSRRRSSTCTGRRPASVLIEHLAVAHRQVAALDQRQAE